MALALAPVDRRTRLEGLGASLRDDVRAMRAVQVRVGRTLLEIRRAGDPLFFAATTFPIFCEAAGLSPVEARDLTAMAEASEKSPEVEARVRAGWITPQKAAIVQQVLRTPEIQRPGEDLLGLVESLPARDLVQEMRRRREQARLGEPPVSVRMHLSSRGQADFRRCRTLVSRSLDRPASEGETLELISDEYLDRHDPERRARRLEGRDRGAAGAGAGAGAARVADGVAAAAGPGSPGAEGDGRAAERSRHVPAHDVRALVRVCGDRCWVDGCGNVDFLQTAHRRPFRDQGSNAVTNLLRLCRAHHVQFDEGLWWMTRRRDGGVVLVDHRGVPVGRLRPEAARFLAEVDGNGRGVP